jgi:quinol monooxygenase YgiN
MIPNAKEGPVLMLVTYKAKKGHENALFQLVKQHWPTMHKLGLSTSTPARVWKTVDRQGGVAFVELFEWRDAKASDIAHQTPEVMAVWEPMANVMDGMEIVQAEPVV